MAKNDEKDGERLLLKMVGAIHAFKMMGSFVDSARYSLYKQIKDSGAHKLMGMDWKEFCAKEIGRDHKTVDAEIKLLEEYGEPFLKMAGQLRLTKRDLNALGNGLPEDAKAEIRRGVVKVGDTEFKVEDLGDNIDEFKAHLELFSRQKDVAEKEAKHAQKSLEGIDKEYKKEIKAYEAKVRDLEAKVVDPALPDGFEDVMKSIERKFDEIHTAVSKLRYDEVYGDDPAEGHKRAMYAARVGSLRNQYLHALHRLSDVFGVNLEDIVNRARNV